MEARVMGRPPAAASVRATSLDVAPPAAAKNASLLYAMAHLAIMFALLAWMYRRRIFICL